MDARRNSPSTSSGMSVESRASGSFTRMRATSTATLPTPTAATWRTPCNDCGSASGWPEYQATKARADRLPAAVLAAGLSWNGEEAHSAVYDTERTAELFCKIVNAWPRQE